MRQFKAIAVEYQAIEKFVKEKVASVSDAMTINEIFNTIKDQVKSKQQVTDAIKSMHKKHFLRRMASFGGRGHVYWYDPMPQLAHLTPVEEDKVQRIVARINESTTAPVKKANVPSIKINPNSIIISSDKYTVTIEI